MIKSKCLIFLLLVIIQSEGRARTWNCTNVESTAPAQLAETTGTTPTYLCMEDWPKTCIEDSECCSGVCLKPFCKILGIEEKEEKTRKKERRQGDENLNSARKLKLPIQSNTNTRGVQLDVHYFLGHCLGS